ncbi:MAG TPA: lysylphosphatidylglycerol synthase transmembrane domain-containing protein [Polyangiaceae bacterium]|nr:lysylphosphatidylglycerol synthase transmembrane domain-containing protein [Polyangiaceae bacterium]
MTSPSNPLRKHAGKLLVSLLFAGGFLWLMKAGTLPFWPDQSAFADVKAWTVIAYVVIWSLVHIVRAWRWKFLLDPIAHVPMRKMLLTSFIGFAAIVLLPMRAGELVRPALVRDKGKLSGWSVTGTVAAERIIDGLVLSLMLLFGLIASTPLNPLPERIGTLPISPSVVPRAAYIALGVFACAFVAMGLCYFARDWMRRVIRAIVGLASKGLADWISDRIERVTLGLSFLPQLGKTIPFILATTGYWLMNAFAAVVLAHGTGLESVTFAQACVLTGVLAIGIMVPNAPGFFGAFQFSAYAALSLFVPEAQLFSHGSTLVFLLFVTQNGIMIAFALVAGALLHIGVGDALAAGDANMNDEGALSAAAPETRQT